VSQTGQLCFCVQQLLNTTTGKPHQQKPDKDNLEKALLDAIFEDDCRIWDGRVSKVWGETGQILIGEIA
jgi:Holliday junction resolvase RusA-like endonuclease